MSVLLAVSGGIDSMYLANRSSDLYPGERFAVAHCNFGLRGSESDGDQTFVEQWCRSREITCFTIRFNTEEHARERGISIEMAARELRYGWFGELCNGTAPELAGTGFDGFRAVAVAHNANDNAETLMLNLLRGTGSRGLRGMAEESRREDGMPFCILRPLLGTSREEIEAWMRANACTWREDSTNAESEYKRNKLRNLAFPIFREINPSFISTLGEDMRRFSQADDIAEDYFLSVKDKCSGPDGISVHALLELKHWEFVLWRLLERCHMSQATFDKLTRLLELYRTRPRGTVTLGGKTFEAQNGIVTIKRRKICIQER